MAEGAVEIVRGGVELLDEVRPLWSALRQHHGAVAPELGPLHEEAESWRRRRAQYEGWLADGRSFVLLARRGGEAVAYAFVRADERRAPTWADDGPYLDLETLSVLPGARGLGVGARMMALVREEVERGGYGMLVVTAVAANADALRFYEREGFRRAFVVLRDGGGRR